MNYGQGPRDWTPREAKIHPNYRCARCKTSGVKLWRQYPIFVELLCLTCAEEDQQKKLTSRFDQIGLLEPAVPTEDGEKFWAYASIPQEGLDWWENLRPSLKEEP